MNFSVSHHQAISCSIAAQLRLDCFTRILYHCFAYNVHARCYNGYVKLISKLCLRCSSQNRNRYECKVIRNRSIVKFLQTESFLPLAPQEAHTVETSS